MAIQTRHYLIEGKVQGVYYRLSTQQCARELALSGWVRNLADGRVEAVASGEEEPLAAFERWLWQGPERAEVHFVIAEVVATQSFVGFEVAPTC